MNRNTETKEGAVSNANATTEGQPATPARVVPTEPGWWWRRGVNYPYVDEVCADPSGDLYTPVCGSPVTHDGYWIAEVPPPAECAAWAAAGRPSAAVLEALGVLSDWIMECIDYPSPETEGNTEAAAEILTRAIRAERAAKGGDA